MFDDNSLLEWVLSGYADSFFSGDLRWFSYATFGWTWKLVGLKIFWHRLLSLVLHFLVCLLLYFLVRELLDAALGAERPAQRATGLDHRQIALCGALLFCVHPVAVYGAAYLVQRSTVMATLFGLASLLALVKGLRQDRTAWLIVSAALYFVAVFSKEHAVMLPAVAAAIALLLARPTQRLARRLAFPGLLYAGIALLVTLKAKGVLGTAYEPFAADLVASLSESQPHIDIGNPWPASVVTEAFLFFKYLLVWLLPWPDWLSVDLRQAFAGGWLGPETAGFVGFVAYGAVAAWLLLRRGAAGVAGLALIAPWLLYFTELATVRLQEPFVLYRSYLWMAIPAGLAPLALARLPARHALAAALAAVIALVPVAVGRLDSFSDPLNLWDDAIRKNRDALPYTERAYDSRGGILANRGQIDEGMADFDRALEINPRFANSLVNRATLFVRVERFPEALRDLDAAVALPAPQPRAFARRCMVLALLGRNEEALADCNRAIDAGSRDEITWYWRGVILSRLRRPAEALPDFEQALARNPLRRESHFYLGQALLALGRTDDALHAFRQSCQLGYTPACGGAGR